MCVDVYHHSMVPWQVLEASLLLIASLCDHQHWTMFLQWFVGTVVNHGNLDVRQMLSIPWFCQNAVFLSKCRSFTFFTRIFCF